MGANYGIARLIQHISSVFAAQAIQIIHPDLPTQVSLLQLGKSLLQLEDIGTHIFGRIQLFFPTLPATIIPIVLMCHVDRDGLPKRVLRLFVMNASWFAYIHHWHCTAYLV